MRMEPGYCFMHLRSAKGLPGGEGRRLSCVQTPNRTGRHVVEKDQNDMAGEQQPVVTQFRLHPGQTCAPGARDCMARPGHGSGPEKVWDLFRQEMRVIVPPPCPCCWDR